MNRIAMAMRSAILALWRQGWSFRRIARELGVHRDTVSRCVRVAREGPKAANPTAGSDRPVEAEFGVRAEWTGGSGPPSLCEPYRETIAEKAEAGLSAQRIHQDLVTEHGFEGSYESVKRFVRRTLTRRPLPFRRMETPPGEQAQVDFGRGALVEVPGGKRRRPHVFRIVLSFSRKGYSEAVWKQTTESFVRCVENAFWHFGGVPRTLVIDNLKAAVTKADWYDPELNPKVESFCLHYRTAVLPTKPYTPRHKGKIESGIGYVQKNALKGRAFSSLEEENGFLLEWETSHADLRIHGTTRKQVKKLFEQEERPALLTLPTDRFPFFHEAERTVHRDGHVELEKAYYSVPPEYLGRRVWVRWDPRVVRVFNARFEEIAVHVKREPGRFSTDPSHIAREKISRVEKGAAYLLKRAKLVGRNAARWAEEMLKLRGVQGVRVLMGLLSLAEKHGSMEIDHACELALSHGAFRLKSVRAMLRSDEKQGRLGFMEEHPVIRSMSEYGRFVSASFGNDRAGVAPLAGRPSAPGTAPSKGESGAGGRGARKEEQV